MTTISAYLNFNGNCREAMTFYKESLGGELYFQTIGESPMAAQMPPEMSEKIMHSNLKKDGIFLMASDMIGRNLVHGNEVTLSLNCSSEEEIKTFFSNLSSGAKVNHPLKVEFWGALFGQLTDRFGMNWMFNYDQNAAQ